MCSPLSVFNSSSTPIASIENAADEQITINIVMPHQTMFLSKLFGNTGISTAISLLRNDRISNSQELTKRLIELTESTIVNETLIQNDPLLALLVLVLKNDSTEDHLRDRAAENYINKHPEDTRFEKGYAYLKTPHILIAHILIVTNQWKCTNPENIEFYDEQLAGLFKGTLAFDKGEQLSSEEVYKIQKQEGENPRFPIDKKLKMNCKDCYEVIDWCCTPPMCSTETRLDDLFIASRRMKQESVIANYITRLQESSGIIQKTYDLPRNETSVVAVIGPYGSGKSEFNNQLFKAEKEVTIYSVDKLSSLLKEGNRPQDTHFEAMMLTTKLVSNVADIPALLVEVAAIDEYRFNQLVNRDFSSRDRIYVKEIASENVSDVVKRLIDREKTSDQSRIGAATTSANDALKYRSKRLEFIQKTTKIRYELYCNPQAKGNDFVFNQVAKIENGVLTVFDEESYKKLVQI